MTNQPLRLVFVEWEDSHGFDGVWQSVEEEVEDKVMVCRSVGWLMLDGAHIKVVASHLTDGGQGAGVMNIPAKAVLRIVDIQAPTETDDSDRRK